MVVLNESPLPRVQPRSWRSGLVPVLATSALLVSACLLTGGGDVEVAFSHAVHVGEKALACTFCHPGAESRDAAGLAPVELCAKCHDEIDRERPPEKRLLAAHYDGYRYRFTGVAAVPPEVRFSHRAHVQDGRLDCAACHGDIAGSDGIPSTPAVTKPDCMGCHTERGVSNECATCHTAIDRAWLPPGHDAGWLVDHGHVVRARSAASADRCELCHDAATSCDACHHETPPRDHTQHFRLRGHGTWAAIDRSRCSTCHHRRDFCQRCHESTPPLDHVAGFGPPPNRHCTACHFPASGSGCNTCHPGGAPHPTAGPMPPWHSPAMNCRQCHGAGVALPHPDGGHACTICHR
jgi:hypothetical protein